MEIHESSPGEPVRQDKRRRAVSLRTEKLRKKSRESRQLSREQLQSGFYLSYTGRNSFRIFRQGWINRITSSRVQYCRVSPSMTRSAVYVLVKMSKQTQTIPAEPARLLQKTWLTPMYHHLELFSSLSKQNTGMTVLSHRPVSESKYWNHGPVALCQYLSRTHSEKTWTVICQRNTKKERSEVLTISH